MENGSPMLVTKLRHISAPLNSIVSAADRIEKEGLKKWAPSEFKPRR